jgi:hypothetical protein
MNTVSGMRCERHKLVERHCMAEQTMCVSASMVAVKHQTLQQLQVTLAISRSPKYLQGWWLQGTQLKRADSATQYLPLELIIQASWGNVQEQSEQQREELARAAPACRKIISWNSNQQNVFLSTLQSRCR